MMWLKTEGERPLGLPNFSKTPAFWQGRGEFLGERWGVKISLSKLRIVPLRRCCQRLSQRVGQQDAVLGTWLSLGALRWDMCSLTVWHCWNLPLEQAQEIKGSCASAQIFQSLCWARSLAQWFLDLLLRLQVFLREKKKKEKKQWDLKFWTTELGYKCWWLDFTAA